MRSITFATTLFRQPAFTDCSYVNLGSGVGRHVVTPHRGGNPSYHPNNQRQYDPQH